MMAAKVIDHGQDIVEVADQALVEDDDADEDEEEGEGRP